MEKIILLHGALGHSGDLEPLATSLRKKGFQTELFDFPGHGSKSFESHFGLEAFVTALQQFIRSHGETGLHIFGYSMGGYVALRMAGSLGFTGNIFTLGTRLSWSPEFSQAEVKKLNPEKMEEKIPAFAEMLRRVHGENWKDLVRNTAVLLEDLGKNNYLDEPFLSSIPNKVTLGTGDQDTMADASDTLRVAKIIRNGKMYMLPGTKHQIESVNTELLAEIMSSVIRN